MATKSTKTDEIKLNIELKGVKAKLQAARIALMDKGLKKTGKNDFAHFEFFQLKDFLPDVQRIFTKLGLTSNFTLMPRVIDVVKTESTSEPIIRDVARLLITDIETNEVEIFEMVAEPVQIGNNSKQNIYQAAGGRSTYYKRYLYRDALEIEEDDESDAVLGQPDVQYTQPIPMPVQQVPYVQQAAPIQQVPQATSIQQAAVEQNIGQPVEINQQGNVQPLQTAPTGNPNDLISQQSKEEVMQNIVAKGLNGFEVINTYCQNNNIASPSELKESDKAGLMAYVGTL